MPSSRFSGLYLSGRALAVILVVVGIAGAMAFYRAHTTPAALWAGITHATEAPLASSQVPTLSQLDHEQELLAERVAPAVVAINVTAHATPTEGGPGALPPDNPLSQFFGQFPRRPPFEAGLGSGIIISPDGYIVTNNHVVENATDIQITLHDLRKFPGKVVGTDPLTDLAVVKIEASGLPNLPWGDSKALKQGDNVFAFGNPFRFNFTMTRGIVSAKGRLSPSRTDLRAPGDYIQTDAAINPGNSGGPLVDSRGEVIGINSFIFTSSGSFSGEAFAIPSEIAQPISAALIEKGKVVRGYLGITIEDLTPDLATQFGLPADTQGALVGSVTAGQAAAAAGLKPGDVITSLNGQKVASATELQLATGSVPPGNTVKLGIIRDAKPMSLSVRLGTAPEDMNKSAGTSAAAAPRTGVELGVTVGNLDAQTRDQLQVPADTQGVVIQSVTPGGPAFNAQLQPGMIIADVNRIPITSTDQLRAALSKLPPGKDILLRIITGGPQAGGTFIVVHPAPAGGVR